MKHIILIGFKHTGKSAIGAKLAESLEIQHVDLDDMVEQLHQEQTGEFLSCRQIGFVKGMETVRRLEKEALHKVVLSPRQQVISVGGGTPLSEHNREIIKQHTVIHVTAPRGIVFERIMVNGKPAFFPENMNPFDAFKQIWDEREPLFESLAHMTVVNNSSLTEAVNDIRTTLLTTCK